MYMQTNMLYLQKMMDDVHEILQQFADLYLPYKISQWE